MNGSWKRRLDTGLTILAGAVPVDLATPIAIDPPGGAPRAAPRP
jgi:hypothetical protein